MSRDVSPQIPQIKSLQNIFSNLNLPRSSFAPENVDTLAHDNLPSLAVESALNQRIFSIINSISRTRATATQHNVVPHSVSNHIKQRCEKPKRDRPQSRHGLTKRSAPKLPPSPSRANFKIKSTGRHMKGKALNPLEGRKGWSGVIIDPPKGPNAPSDSNQSIPLRLPLGRGQLTGANDERDKTTKKRPANNERFRVEKTELLSEQPDARSNDVKPRTKATKRKRSSTELDSKRVLLTGSNGKKRLKLEDDPTRIPKVIQSRHESTLRATLPSKFANIKNDEYEDETLDGSDGEEARKSAPRELTKRKSLATISAVNKGKRMSDSKTKTGEKNIKTSVVDLTNDDDTSLVPRGLPRSQASTKRAHGLKPGSLLGKNKRDSTSNTDSKPFNSNRRPTDKRDVVPTAKEELLVLAGSSGRKVRNISLDEATLAKKEQIRRESIARKDKMKTAPIAQVDSSFRKAYEAIMNFSNGSSNISKLTLTDKKLYRFKRFSLAIIPGCEALCYVDIISYLFLLGSAHCRMIHDLYLSSVESITSFKSFDGLSTDMDKMAWIYKTRKCRLERIPAKFKESFGDEVIPPFLEKTTDVIQLATRLFQKFISSDDEVSERFIDDWYARLLSRQMGAIALGVMGLWKKYDLKPHEDSEISVLFELALRLLSKLFLFEMRQPSIFPDEANKESLLIFNFTEAAHEANVCRFVVREVFDTGINYLSLTNGYRREGGVAFIEMAQSYFTSLFFPCQKVKAIETIWNDVKDSDYADVLAANDVFWTNVVLAPLQSALKAGQKIHEAQSEVEFAVAVLRHPQTCRSVFTSQPKIKETILDLAIRGLKEMSRDLLAVYMDIWEYKKEFWDGVTIMDLIKILLTYGFSQRELVCTSDERRNAFLDIMRDLITNSGRLAWEPVGSDCVDDWWRHGPFGRTITTLQSDTEPVRLVRTINERNARLYAFSCLGWLVGSLGVSYEDGSREISNKNTINSLLQRVTSPRGARQFLEELLTIQNHLERNVKISVHETKPSRQKIPAYGTKTLSKEAGKPKKKRTIDLFSACDRANFSIVVEAVRERVCELKNISPAPVRKRPAIRPFLQKRALFAGRHPSAPPRPPPETLIFPDITSISCLQLAVVSERGYINREENRGIMLSLAGFLQDESQYVISLFDPKAESATKWKRLLRNTYVENARELLTSEERAVGQMCTCLPGLHTKDDDAKVGCVNDKCENRSAKVECGPGPCGAGDYCQNRRLQNLEYVKTKKNPIKDKGIGLNSATDVHEGQLIGEYQGEVISSDEFARRKKEYIGERHFYFMVLTKNLIIDASRKSQVTRFVNHSCDPNCEAQKWNAGGEPRVAIIAKRFIRKGEELTFDYGAMAIGNESDPCFCGTAKCRGTLASTKESGASSPSPPKKNETDTDALLKADKEEVSRLKQEKINKASERLQWANKIKEECTLQKSNNSHVSNLEWNDEQKRKLDIWKRSVIKKSTLFPSPKKIVKKPAVFQARPPALRSAPLNSIKIPIQSALVPKKQSDDGSGISVQTYLKHIFNRGGPAKDVPDPKKKISKVSGSKNEQGSQLSRFVPGATIPDVPKPLDAPQVPPPKLKGILKPRSRYPYAPGAAPSLFPGLIKERPHVGPLESIPGEKKISVFKPSKSKFLEARKKRRPKIQPKKKTYKYCPDGENDSMAGYSTASDVSSCGSDYEPPPYYQQSWVEVNQTLSTGKPSVETAIAAMIREREGGRPEKERKAGESIEKPGESNEKPGKDDEKSGKDDEKSGKDDEKPGKDDEKPGKDDEKPGKDDEKPGKDGEKSSKDGEKSSKDGEKSAKDGEKSAKDGEKSAKDEEKLGSNAAQRVNEYVNQATDEATSQQNERLKLPALKKSKDPLLTSVLIEVPDRLADCHAPLSKRTFQSPRVEKILSKTADSHVMGSLAKVNEQNTLQSNRPSILSGTEKANVAARRSSPVANPGTVVQEDPSKEVEKVSDPSGSRLSGIDSNTFVSQDSKSVPPGQSENFGGAEKHHLDQTGDGETQPKQPKASVSGADNSIVIVSKIEDHASDLSVKNETVEEVIRTDEVSVNQLNQKTTSENSKLEGEPTSNIRDGQPSPNTIPETGSQLDIPSKTPSSPNVQTKNREADSEVFGTANDKNGSLKKLNPTQKNGSNESQREPALSNNSGHEPIIEDNCSLDPTMGNKEQLCVLSDHAVKPNTQLGNAEDGRNDAHHTPPRPSEIERPSLTGKLHSDEKPGSAHKPHQPERNPTFHTLQSGIEDAPNNWQHGSAGRYHPRNNEDVNFDRSFRGDRRSAPSAGSNLERISNHERDRYGPPGERGRNRQHLNHHDFAREFDSSGASYSMRYEHRRNHRFARGRGGLRGFAGEGINTEREPAAGIAYDERTVSGHRFGNVFHQRGGRSRFSQAANWASGPRRDDWSHVRKEPPRPGVWNPVANESVNGKGDTLRNMSHTNGPGQNEVLRIRRNFDRNSNHGYGDDNVRANAPEIKSQPKDLRHLLKK